MEEGKNLLKNVGLFILLALISLSVDRKGLLIISIVTAVCAALSTFSPNYNCLLALRMMVRFAVGGGPVYGSWLLEFVPSQNRGMWTIICTAFWTIGTIHEALLALVPCNQISFFLMSS